MVLKLTYGFHREHTFIPSMAELNQALRLRLAGVFPQGHAFSELAFVEQERLSSRQKMRRRQEQRLALGAAMLSPVEDYVTKIIQEKKIPTRVNHWHDYYNALSWIQFPRSKLALYERYYAAHFGSAEGNKEGRPKLNDLLTCLDEGGVVVVTAVERLEEVTRVVAARDLAAKEALLREGAIEVVVFGHGLMESFAAGKWDINALAPVVTGEDVDTALANWLRGFSESKRVGSFPCGVLRLTSELAYIRSKQRSDQQ